MSEIGEIGVIYEDRRTKKKGKLVERDDKYKTLLMEASDGKSFNITFGGFKSNWRKVDEPEQTLEEAMKDELPEEKSVIKEPKKTSKKSIKKKVQEPIEVSEGFENTTKALIDYVNSFEGILIRIKTTPKNRSNAVIVGKSKVFELIYGVRKNDYTICIAEKLAAKLKNKPYIKNMVYHEKWVTTKYSCRMEFENLNTFLDEMRDVIIAKSIKEEDN